MSQASPHRRRKVAWRCLVLSVIIGWPLSVGIAFLPEWMFKIVVTGMSALALTLAFWEIWQSSDVRVKQEEDT